MMRIAISSPKSHHTYVHICRCKIDFDNFTVENPIFLGGEFIKGAIQSNSIIYNAAWIDSPTWQSLCKTQIFFAIMALTLKTIQIPKMKFYNGYEVPVFGLGTWKSKPGEVTEAVKYAIDIGYRHIDCAQIYGNEKEIGEAIHDKIKEGIVKREDLFITSKLWNTFHNPNLVEPALKKTLTDLGLDYVDLYLIHWPFGYKEGGDLFPTNPDGSTALSDVDYLDTWKAMEKMLSKGLTKNIGVSNFNSEQITRLLNNAMVKPVTNQIECHPYLTQQQLSNFCKEKDILITAYSPLGSPDRPWAQPDDPKLLDDTSLIELGQKYKKTPAQILIRYQLDRGHIVIPKSVTKSRIAQNMEVFDFKLSSEDISRINSFDCNGRICPLKNASASPYYPFNIPF